ncbi:MAG TPA: hypothetical protein VH639_14545 [Bryobacteraceae bacterium]|jgi:hypothetical protein
MILNTRLRNANLKKAALGKVSDGMLSEMLGALPKRTPPPGLRTSLRVEASMERQRMLAQNDPWGAFLNWCDRLRVLAHNAMGPVALPAAGGAFSAVLLLGMWVVPTYPFRANTSFDVPTVLTTDVGVKSAGAAHLFAQAIAQAVAVAGDDVVVDVTIDDQGRMVDYNVVSGPASVQEPGFRRRLENLLLLTEFDPATAFGHPRLSTLRLTLSPSHVDVKG